MGKIIDRVRARERKAWWVTHARLTRESDAKKDAQWANLQASRNMSAIGLEGALIGHAQGMNMAALQNSEEAKRWNAQSVEPRQSPMRSPWWAFWR
jgi:hypothetical protein